MKEITDNQLADFAELYKKRSGKTHTYVSSLAISMAGHFHITQKMAEPLVWRIKGLGLIHVKNRHDVYFTNTDEPDFRPFGQEW